MRDIKNKLKWKIKKEKWTEQDKTTHEYHSLNSKIGFIIFNRITYDLSYIEIEKELSTKGSFISSASLHSSHNKITNSNDFPDLIRKKRTL
jgi:hypothetical protein